MHGIQGTKIALLIDFDNVILGVEDPGFDVELVVNALRSRGVIVMGRAYGDWYRHHRHRRKLMEQGIELVETPVFGPVIKNSADIRIVLDGIDIATAHQHIDAFCLVSGDSDFLPLIKRLQLLGKTVIVIAGQKFTSDLVRRNCNEYIAYENLLAESVGATEDVSTLDGAFKLLHRAISTLNERGMDIRSSTVKQMMLQLNPAFSERSFGCNQFKGFLDKAARAGIVKLGDRDGTSGEYAVLITPEADSILEIKPVTSGRNESNNRDNSSRGRNERSSERSTNERNTRGRASERKTSTSPATTSATATAETPTSTDAPSVAAVPNLAEVDDAHIAPVVSTPLSARSGLRRGRLRFSAKSGRSTVLREGAATESTEESVGAETSTENAAVPESDIPAPETSTPEAQVTTIASAETVSEAAQEDAPNVAAKPAAKKRTTRGGRRRKAAPGEGDVVGVEEETETAAKSKTPKNSGEIDAAQADVTPAVTESAVEASSAEASGEATENAAPKKTTRGRRGGTRRTTRAPKAAADSDASAEASSPAES